MLFYTFLSIPTFLYPIFLAYLSLCFYTQLFANRKHKTTTVYICTVHIFKIKGSRTHLCIRVYVHFAANLLINVKAWKSYGGFKVQWNKCITIIVRQGVSGENALLIMAVDKIWIRTIYGIRCCCIARKI